MPRQFPTVPVIESQAQAVSAYRKGNGLPRSSYVESLEDVSTFQCWRMNNDPAYCVECEGQGMGNLPMSENTPGLKPCKGCGAVLSP